LSGAEAS